MADVDISFKHPTDGRLLNVQLDDTITAQEAIAELISEEFIHHNSEGYQLAIKDGAMIGMNQSFLDANVRNGTVLRVIPATDAGEK